MADTSARDKLRSMGGIMASSEELMRAVDERLSGRTFAPGYDLQTPTMRSAVREEGLDYPSFELLRRTTPSRRTLQALGYPESSVGGSMYFDRLAAGMGLADPDKKMPPYDTSLGAGFRTQPLERPGLTDQQRALFRVAPPELTGDDIEALKTIDKLGETSKTIADLERKSEEARLGSVDQAALAAAKAEEMALKKSLDIQRDEDIVMGQEVVSDERRAELETARQNQPRFDPLAGAKKAADAAIDKKMNADAAAPKELARRIADATERQINDPEPKAKKDLRSRYSENIALFKEIYGVDEEDRARDKMMSLAMIGLAIAAGQSPNALTNIAQGALTGLKSMSESEAERRQQDRDLRTAALEAALSSEAAATEAEARAAEKEYDRETELGVQLLKNAGDADAPEVEKQRQEYLYNDVFRTTLSTELENNPGNVQAALQKARLAAVTAAPQAPSASAGGAVSPVVGTPDAGVEKMIAAQRAANATDDQIRKMLEEAGKNGEAKFNPALYGL